MYVFQKPLILAFEVTVQQPLSILANNLLIRAPRGKTDYLYYFLKKFREIAQIA